MPKKKAAAERGQKASFRCRLCEKAVRIPQGWTRGPAVRRHYWKKHPEVMQPERSS